MRKLFILSLQVLFLFSVMVAGFTSCTTGENDEGSIEGELNAELDEMSGEEIEGGTTAETDVEDVDIGDEDFEEDNFEDDGSSKVADKNSDPAAPVDEDDEFLAEDSEKPTTASADDLAEKDLEKELEKTPSVADTKAEEPPAPAYPEDTPPAVAAAPVAPMDAPVAPEDATATAVPNSAGVATGTVTSKESGFSNDPFEQIVSASPSLPSEDLGVSDPLVTDVDPPLPSLKAAQEVVPVSKVDKDPFFRNERLMNTVYIARPNDDLPTISQRIYNEDRTANLLADNPHVTKGVEPGDKLYYNSPNRPEDKKAIITFYEDNKMAPSYYKTEKGDDIKKIGRQVLGFEDAWKEVWAVNESLQTQALLPAGLKIRYWSGNEMKSYDAPAPAAATVEKETPVPVSDPAPEVPIDLPPMETASLPSEDPGLQLSGDSSSMPADTLTAPPALDAASSNDSSLMTIAGGAIAVLAVLALVAIQIKNRRREDPNMPPSLEFNKV